MQLDIHEKTLWNRWPSRGLMHDFVLIFHRYQATLEGLGNGKNSKSLAENAFSKLSANLVESFEQPYSCCCNANAVSSLSETYLPINRLEKLASLLGMMMHFDTNGTVSSKLLNRRRPKRLHTTYPTSPYLARFMTEYVMMNLLKHQIPNKCKRVSSAEAYAKRALSFKIVDPSMESGYFLLQIALYVVRKIYEIHKQESIDAKYLIRALLEKLCSDCLWGIDINPRAICSAHVLFSLLASQLDIPVLKIQNLITGDSIKLFKNGKVNNFDGIINNPPWGKPKAKSQQNLIKTFSMTQNSIDTYIAFSELAVECLRPQGTFGLIIPSQFLGAQNCRHLRRYISHKCMIDHLVLLPRDAFVDATVRGLVLLGKVKAEKAKAHFMYITKYPLTKRIGARGDVKKHRLKQDVLTRTLEQNWNIILNDDKLFLCDSNSVRLKHLADILSGVQLYGKGQGHPPQTSEVFRKRPFNSKSYSKGMMLAIGGKNIHDFSLDKHYEYILYGPWLARAGQLGELKNEERIFVRELCRRDGKINAAIAPKGIIPLKGVLTIIPKKIDPYLLLAILNSQIAVRYVRYYSNSFTKVDFQRITIAELGMFPIPLTFLDTPTRKHLGYTKQTQEKIAQQSKIIKLTHALEKLKPTASPDYNIIRENIEQSIEKIYEV